MAAPVETKVKASSVTAVLVGLVVAVLNDVEADASLLGPLPAWLQGLVLALAPGALVFLAGYRTRHTPRDVADPLAKNA
ncbi:holin [Streptomyces sp. NPDC048332]|uniref:holin n=1 Tax=Streptomyces sp. NPDC048332 TaxID=3154619 RepID=UPI00344A99C1